jgi:hypothetical protein
MYEHTPAPIPALHDWFYMDRIAELIDDGALRVVTEGKDLRFHMVSAATMVVPTDVVGLRSAKYAGEE